MLEIELIQVALGIKDGLSRVPSQKEWDAIYAFAERHGIIGVLFGGIERLGKLRAAKAESEELRGERKSSSLETISLSSKLDPLSSLPMDLLMDWLGQAEYQKTQYEEQRKAVDSLVALWEAAGLHVVELKGNSIGQYYPRPELRYSCDFDCFLSDYEEGNRIVEVQGVPVNREFYKNSSFMWKGLHVENHQFCCPVRGNKRMKRFERLLRALLVEKVVPAQFNALFLMEHMWAHFFEEALTMKQVLDWVVFRKECSKDVNWRAFESAARDCGFWEFACAMNKIVDNIQNHSEHSEPLNTKEARLWQNILQGGGTIEMNNGWSTRFQLIGNYFRNSWKYRNFAPHGALYTLARTSIAYIFDKNPKI